jgi:hypothetical protein
MKQLKNETLEFFTLQQWPAGMGKSPYIIFVAT